MTTAGPLRVALLRLYQTLVEVSGEASSTIVFPVPIDLTGMGAGAAGATPAVTQAMMQSATALAAQAKIRAQLGELKNETSVPASAPETSDIENPFARRR